jgi:hypothetical protein
MNESSAVFNGKKADFKPQNPTCKNYSAKNLKTCKFNEEKGPKL